jgi:murein L,D-transpeptidase YcbB/YkuD
MLKSLNILFLFIMFQTCLHGDWTKSLGELQNSKSVKKSYLIGLLTERSYGIYKIEGLKSKKNVLALYEKNGYSLYWFEDTNILDDDISNMIDMIKKSENEGLNPAKYHLNDIEFLYKKISGGLLFDNRDQNLATIKLDILLSDAFFALAKDFTQGLIDYEKFKNTLLKKSEEKEIDYRWDTEIADFDYLDFLEQSKSSGNIKDALTALIPTNTIYVNLKDAYNRYKTIEYQGGFVKIKPGKNLKLGSVSDRVIDLRIRLNQSWDLDFADENNKKFDKELKTALKRFQKRVGIWASGVLNSTTIKALNVPLEKRLEVIKLNLERSRWERDSFDYRYIIVNIPEFLMRFMENDQELLRSRVIVGKTKNPTPIFQSKMSYVVLNPRWSVPNSIVTKELLEKIQEDPYYLEERNYKMYNGWSKKRQEIDPFDVDWFKYDEDSKIPFNIVKDSGEKNPLGNVKFMFPNNHAVYMHDTPNKSLFKNSVRAYSHGCIRLHQPQKLLEFVSDSYLGAPYREIKSKLDTGDNQSLTLRDKIPVYIRYYTAFVDQNGGVNFGRDIYGYDKIQKKLLEKNN